MADRSPVHQAVILVGGRGTRLGGLTDATPKPLLPCGDRPFLAWVLRELTRFGIENVLLLTGYLGDKVEQALPRIRQTLPKPLGITCVWEAEPAGTGGALFNARAQLAERFLLCNGDSWLDCNLARLIVDADCDPAETVGRMLLRRLSDAGRYGVVETEGDHVTAFRERPTSDSAEAASAGTINAGIYLLDRHVLSEISPFCSLERDVLPTLAARGSLRGTTAEGYFIDIGIPDDLARAQQELPARLRRPAVFIPQQLVIEREAASGDATALTRFRPGAASALRHFSETGWHVFLLVEPRTGVSSGRDPILRAMPISGVCAALRAEGAVVDDVCRLGVALAFPDGKGETGVSSLANTMMRWELDPQRCRLVGDTSTAPFTAETSGIPQVRVNSLGELQSILPAVA